jgi:predicted nucleic acid-binding protein
MEWPNYLKAAIARRFACRRLIGCPERRSISSEWTRALLIAAHAVSQNLILLTRNRKDFKRVSGLKADDWTKSHNRRV